MPGSGNKGDRGDGQGGGVGGGVGGGGGGMGGPGRDTISAVGGGWARMGNFRGDPGLGGGGAVGYSGITTRDQALAAMAQNPNLAQMSGLAAAVARGAFGTAPAGQKHREQMPAMAPGFSPPPAPPPRTQFSPPTRTPNPAPPSPPPRTPGFWGTNPWARNPDAWSDPRVIGPEPDIGWSNYNRINGDTYSNLGEWGPGMGTGTGFIGTGFSGTFGRDNPAVGRSERGPGGGRAGGRGGGMY